MAENQKSRILVVDDEADIVSYFTVMLEDAGYEVASASNGQEALDVVRRERPDLITLDITMPEKSGVKFYREIKEDEALRGIPVVIVTGVTTPLEGARKEGSFEKFLSSRRQIPPPDAFFEKPIDAQLFLARIAELLGTVAA